MTSRRALSLIPYSKRSRSASRFVIALLLVGCGRAASVPAEHDAAPPASPVDAAIAIPVEAPDAAKPDPKIPITKHPVVDGMITLAFLETQPPVAVKATALPFTAIPSDQRVDSGTIDPPDDYLRRAEPPFTQVATYRDKQGHRFLALVEARKLATIEQADDAPMPWWFAAKSGPRPLSGGLAWRVWKGAVGHRQWNPDVLAVESANGDIVATRYLGAVLKVEPLGVDPATPMWVATVLENASGVDDGITLVVVGFVDRELRVLRSVEGGPRSVLSATATVGPLGSVSVVTANGHRAVRIRDIDASEDCTPAAITETGCTGKEHVDAWDPAAHRFEPGAATPLRLRQKIGGAVTVVP